MSSHRTAAGGPRSPADERPGGRTGNRGVLLACILSSCLVGMDGMMTTVALPGIATELGGGLAVQQWVVAAFLVGLGSLLLVGGALGDVYDRWLVFGVGTAGFGVGALLSALAPTAPLLIGGRFLQGAMAALMVPSALAVITTSYPAAEQTRAIGVWTAWSSLSIVVGPVCGGLLVTLLSWRAVFAVLVPLAAVVVFLIARAAPPGPRARRSGSIDLGGALLAVPFTGGPAFVVIQGPAIGWSHPLVAGAGLATVVSAVAFAWWERRAANPLLPLFMFRNRDFALLNLATFVLYGSFISCGVYTVLFLQQTAGYPPTVAAAAAAVPVIVLFFLAGRFGAIAERYGPRLLVGGGSFVVGLGILLLVRADAKADLAAVVLPSVLLHGLGLAMIVAPLTSGVLGAAAPGHAGAASGINNAVARIGSLLGVAVAGMLISMQFSLALDRDLAGVPLSAAARHAVEEARSLPLTTTPAAGLSTGEQRVLHEARVNASTDAFRAGVWFIGGLPLLAGVLVFAGLPGRRGHFRARALLAGPLALRRPRLPPQPDGTTPAAPVPTSPSESERP